MSAYLSGWSDNVPRKSGETEVESELVRYIIVLAGRTDPTFGWVAEQVSSLLAKHDLIHPCLVIIMPNKKMLLKIQILFIRVP